MHNDPVITAEYSESVLRSSLGAQVVCQIVLLDTD